MSKRIVRSVALMVGAGALVLGAAAPAMAANVGIESLPAKVMVAGNDTVTVTIENPADFTCAQAVEGGVGWSTRVVGQKAGIASVSDVTCDPSTNKATWTVTVANTDKKKNAVVKFIAKRSIDPSVENAKTVKTLVVKVNKGAKPQTGKPANAGKPSSE